MLVYNKLFLKLLCEIFATASGFCFTASTEESGSGFPYLPVAIGAGVVILIAGVYIVKHRSCS